MNYIEIKNEFWKQHRMQHFNDADHRIFDFLVDQYYSILWQNPFVIRISSIEKELDMERSTVRRSLDRLKDRGLITYSNGDRGQGRIVMINWADITDMEMLKHLTSN